MNSVVVQPSPPPASPRSEAVTSGKHLIITVHGIRSFGKWQERLETMLLDEVDQKEHLTVHNYKYGYFSAFAFLVPFLRWLVVIRFRRALMHVVQDTSWERIDLVSHSFGTHIIAWGLHGIKVEQRPKIHTIILSGSVLRTDFPWDDLIGSSVARVVNDCGTRDNVLLLSQFCVLFTGMAGRAGFTGMTSKRLRNRFNDFGHGGYFFLNGSPDNAFMRTYWVPLLTSDVEVPIIDEGREGVLSGPIMFLANNAEPIKLTVYLTPLVFTIASIYGLYVEADQQRQIAMSRVLALEADEADDPDLSIRLSLEALRIRDTVETRRSIVKHTTQALGLEAFTYLCCADNTISAIAFTEDSQRVFTGDEKGNLLQWGLATHGSSPYGESLGGEILLIATAGDGSSLVVVAANRVSVFDLIDNTPKAEALDIPFQEISSAALSKDGNSLALGDHQGRIAVLDRRTKKWSSNMTDPTLREAVISLAFHPSEELLAASYNIPPVDGFEQPIVLWDTSTGIRVDPPFLGHGREVTSLGFSFDGKQLVSSSWDHDIRVWATDTRLTIPPVLVEAARGKVDPWETFRPTYLAVSPDGQTIISLMANKLAMWDATSHKNLWQLSGLIEGTTLAISPNSKHVGIGGESKNLLLISTDFDHWLHTACQLSPRRLTEEETRYYFGEYAERHMLMDDPCVGSDKI